MTLNFTTALRIGMTVAAKTRLFPLLLAGAMLTPCSAFAQSMPMTWKSYLQTGNIRDIVPSVGNDNSVASWLGKKADTQNGHMQNPVINQRAITTAPLQTSDVGSASGIAGLDTQRRVTNPLVGTAYGDIMYNNDPTAVNLKMPTIKCSGNSMRGNAAAYGAVCVNVISNPDSETYNVQSRVLNQTRANSEKAVDVVAGYFGVDTSPFSTLSWAVNALVNDGPDGGGYGAGVIEVDANNVNCDNADPDGNYYPGGEASLVKTRSDGSACPDHRGITIGGLTSHVGTAGILFANSPMTNGANQFEDGIDMIGYTAIGSNEIYANTVAQNNIKWKGVHTRGIDDRSAQNHYAFASLPNDSVGGRILWECADDAASTCVNGGNIGPWGTGVRIIGGQSEIRGADDLHQFGLGFTIKLPDGTIEAAPDKITGLLPAGGSYDLGFSDGNATSIAMSVSQHYITMSALPSLPNMTTAEIKALQYVPWGALVMDSDIGAPLIYYKGSWYPIQLGAAL